MITITKKVLILHLLGQKKFLSGEEMAAELGISRAAVGKHIAALNELGIDIFSVKGRGYSLNSTLNLLDFIRAREGIESLHYFESIDSTNQYLLNRINTIADKTVCIAEMQTHGRGRRGRQWQSPFATSLYYSQYCQFNGPLAQTSGLSLVVALTLASTLQQLGVEDVSVKWPNDIYLSGKKLAGILLELSGQSEGPCHLILGIGLNLRLEQNTRRTIEQEVADLSAYPIDKTTIVIALHKNLLANIERYTQYGLEAFIPQWYQFDGFLNREVKVILGNHEFHGKHAGIDNFGQLLLEQDGVKKPFAGGEVSLRLLP